MNLSQRNNLQRLALFGFALPLVIYALIGVYSRLMSDDFCYGATVIEHGYVGALGVYYEQWFGRLTQVAGAAAGATLGVPFAQMFPAALIAVWVLAAWWLVRELERAAGRSITNPLLIAVLIIYGTLAGTPQILHSLYWISAVFPFMFPLALLTLFGGIAARSSYHSLAWWMLIGAALLPVIAGMASEQYAVVQISLFAALLVAFRRSPARVTLGIGLIAAVIALVIVLLAPGNTYRQSLFTPTHDPVALALNSLISAAAFVRLALADFTYFAPGAVIAALLLIPLLREGRDRLPFSRWWILAVTFGLIVAFCLPAVYATSLPPPARTYSIAQFVLIAALVLFSLTIRLRVSPRVRAALVIALLVIAPALTTIRLVGLVPALVDAAAAWDERDALIRAAEPGTAVSVPPLRVDVAGGTGLDNLMGDPGYWINECAATYYGVASISVAGD